MGKTTAIREILAVARKPLASVVICTSNEIGGDGDRAPFQASAALDACSSPTLEAQHKVMIEAVENHMPRRCPRIPLLAIPNLCRLMVDLTLYVVTLRTKSMACLHVRVDVACSIVQTSGNIFNGRLLRHTQLLVSQCFTLYLEAPTMNELLVDVQVYESLYRCGNPAARA
jgi:hypothetical protein